LSATPARQVAYEVLRRVFEHGAWADRTLRAAAERSRLEGRERALAQRLAYGAVQRRGTCDELIERLAGRRMRKIDPPLAAALRLGMFELLFDDSVAEHAAVDQAVELAKGGRDGGRRHSGAGMVNAVLRRAAREREELLATLGEATAAEAAISHSLPPWIAELWWDERGPEQALALMRAANEPPARTYRVNPAREAAAGEPLEARLRAAGVELAPAPELIQGLQGAALLEVSGGDWEAVEAAVGAGDLTPQSPGSAAAVALLGVQPGERVLDLCAAPGIKTTQLAAVAGAAGSVTAVERDGARASTLIERCELAGVGDLVEVVVADGTRLDPTGDYDRVLVDAPCSGLGTLASRPDARWHRDAESIEPTAVLQEELLRTGAAALRPGGSLIYSVCTISRREAVPVVEAALAADPALRADDLGALCAPLADDTDPRFLQTLPGRDRSDGFFIARMTRAGG
jgi:16S rRNA (cytosine967-C5)-methyltransferase